MTTCLIVDDSSVIRKVARRILENLGLEVEEAEDGEVGLRFCRQSMPDAIMLDWSMPKMDGITFLNELKRQGGGKRPKVIFCVAEQDVAMMARAMRAGASDFLMKPFDSDIVEAKFQEAGIL